MAEACRGGETAVEALLAIGRDHLTVDQLDYLELLDAESLTPIQRVEAPARALVAAFVGSTRLIDNVSIGPELSWT